MKTNQVYLAIDLGAESGRVIAGLWNGKTLKLEEIHRFPNGPVLLADSLRWDVLRLWNEIQTGLALAAKKFGKRIVSVGADTWGVDYVLLNRRGEMLGQPFAYRDARTNGVMEKAFKRVPRAEIFAQTGLQFMQFNTLFQLLAHKRAHPDMIAAADTLLFMPDFLHWALCGARVAEFTIASTSQCLHPLRRDWAGGLLKQFDLPRRIFPEIVPPGTKLGPLRASVAERTGLTGVNVVAPPAHDTASAVAGVPTANTGKANWAYISSGTWSLMGVEVQQAALSARAQEINVTNEGGVDGTYRLLKNIMGLWLVQQCKRSFDAAGRKFEYAELARLAAGAKPLRSIVDPDDRRFLNPPDMPKAIQSFCRETGQPVPKTAGELVRCAYESLALKYREVLGWLEELTGSPREISPSSRSESRAVTPISRGERIEVIHIVGGGSQSRVLNQFAAEACQRPVVTGPVEATAMGNLLTQVRACGELASLTDMRVVIRKSSDVGRFEPRQSAAWREGVERFGKLRGSLLT